MGKIWRVSGPVIIGEDMKGSQVYEIVEIGSKGLVGEIIGLDEDKAIIQAHEDTQSLEVGETVRGTGAILTAELGPGIVGAIYDGLQKSLTVLMEKGSFIERGAKVFSLPRDKKWSFTPTVKVGDVVNQGDIIGTVPETSLIVHKIMVPVGVKGVVKEIAKGEYTIEEPVARISDNGKVSEVIMLQKWPVRKPRPYKQRLAPSQMLITGTRIMDYMFPLALGGKAAIPGGFGTGKTVALQQLARWSQTQLNIYVGCGERGNEMADVLYSFRRLKDPATGSSLQDKEIFIANTSNMPVVAREASIFVGITIAEYFRDMGYDVLLVCDSTSRWAEAMREIGGRLEEIPGEEGFPAYLGSRLAAFYERAGLVECAGNPQRQGSVTVVGAVSPPGADFSEPVTQNTLRIIDVFYALDVTLANKRHFPAINWLTSYSLYVEDVKDWWAKVSSEWDATRATALRLLQKEAELEEIVRLVGPEALPETDKLVMVVTRMMREDFLMQSAYNEIDTYCTPQKGQLMMGTIVKFYELAQRMLDAGATVADVRSSPIVAKISRMKDIANDDIVPRIKGLWSEMEMNLVVQKGEVR
ncbi:MAG: V-type ATP synthase subunit A [Dehalococcoidales bacterium]|nr:V-type ATP synthase subunit A [Dehalococcoidales bacterium]